jgi:hypothetical protein
VGGSPGWRQAADTIVGRGVRCAGIVAAGSVSVSVSVSVGRRILVRFARPEQAVVEDSR